MDEQMLKDTPRQRTGKYPMEHKTVLETMGNIIIMGYYCKKKPQ